ncbi:helix-turn-helix domain-containing protein [Pseudobacteroides cellulosolvens]|uniref:Transcriptional regulator, PucR family n=1 Tax=Pseudobacteroides cellulosolvens ATCC 35603 = DSM 2933 TaxID=398512 RepID=A0A0L6JQC3_9FIRM|nr:helix-turn-helix domain-containing protein [Pseudobacteroides cellulosolvens]KNY27989.1 transcriptional regulator, PucR family [Pseudobacteroides cellulosolvens ATCC 35603 = DSM 2933]
MPLLCSALFHLSILKDLKQIAGFEGNRRIIQWVVRTDLIKACEGAFSLIKKDDLVIVSGNNSGIKIKDMLALVNEAYKREAAGIIVCYAMTVENLTYEVIELSNELKMPLFEMYMHNGTEVKIEKEICKAIIVDELNDTSDQNILECILNNENLDNGYIAECLNACGMSINNSNQAGIVKFEGFEDYIKENYQKYNDKITIVVPELNNTIKNAASLLCPPRNIITAISNDSVVFLTTAFDDKDEIEEFLFKVDREMREKIPGTNLSLGLGGAHLGVAGINRSLREARQMLILKQVEGLSGLTHRFPHFDVYFLLMSLKDRKLLEKYLDKILKPLLSYDRLNQSDLIDTLDAYLNENASTIEASDKLFIHKNTLKYRLKKIESLLDVDLHSLEDCLRLLLAIKIHKLFKLSSEVN